MIFRQLFDHKSYTYTYLIADSDTLEACIIDPVLENVNHYIQLIEELELSLNVALDTHVHADHITALGSLRSETQCRTLVGAPGDVSCANDGFIDGQIIPIGRLALNVIFTPGHTDNSFCFYLKHNGSNYVFTGDTLLIRGTGRTDFQCGSADQLFHSLHNKLLMLPDETLVYPGHDYKGWTVSTILEEKRNNPRLLIHSKSEFIDHMNNLKLSNPKMMDVAIPANLACGINR